MKLTQNDFFYTQTAQPFSPDFSYREILPDKELRPYIRCFWQQFPCTKNERTNQITCSHFAEKHETSAGNFQSDFHLLLPKQRIIIPDACMDIILKFDSSNSLESAHFCTIDKLPHIFTSDPDKQETIFGIRFFAWTAGFFSAEKINGISGKTLDAEPFFPIETKKFFKELEKTETFHQKADFANRYFLEKISHLSFCINPNLTNFLTDMIKARGSQKIQDVFQTVQKSERQIQRIFKEQIGISPKSLSSIIRYQNLWCDLLRNPSANIQDLVFKYDFFDQSHLTENFKRYHGMNIRQALNYAFKQTRDLH